jgi:hypothetical protein
MVLPFRSSNRMGLPWSVCPLTHSAVPPAGAAEAAAVGSATATATAARAARGVTLAMLVLRWPANGV